MSTEFLTPVDPRHRACGEKLIATNAKTLAVLAKNARRHQNTWAKNTLQQRVSVVGRLVTILSGETGKRINSALVKDTGRQIETDIEIMLSSARFIAGAVKHRNCSPRRHRGVRASSNRSSWKTPPCHMAWLALSHHGTFLCCSANRCDSRDFGG